MIDNFYQVEEMEDTQKGKYLTFTLDSEVYGLEIKYVIDIIGVQQITQVPDQPEYVNGVINLRGKIIPTMDIRKRFNKDVRAFDKKTCIIVVDMNGISVGIIVDTVLEVLFIEDENISAPPRFNGDYQSKYIDGIGKNGDDVMILLDCTRLLNMDELGDMSGLEL